MVSQPQMVKYPLCKQAAKPGMLRREKVMCGAWRVGGCAKAPSRCVEPIRGAPPSPPLCPPVGSGDGAGEGARAGGDFAVMFNIQVT